MTWCFHNTFSKVFERLHKERSNPFYKFLSTSCIKNITRYAFLSIVGHQQIYKLLRKRSCEKIMFLHLSVGHSVHRGVSVSVHAGITTPLTPPLGIHPPWVDTPSPWAEPPPPSRRPLQRTVRILLECFLVFRISAQQSGLKLFFKRISCPSQPLCCSSHSAQECIQSTD